MKAPLLSGGLLCVLVIAAPPSLAMGPEEAASYCYDQAKKMGFSSRDMEDRSWEDCMNQFRQRAQPSGPAASAQGLSPQERAVILQHLLNPQNRAPAPDPFQRLFCNQQGGYLTPDGQCLKPQPPQPPPSYSCRRVGDTTTCTPWP